MKLGQRALRRSRVQREHLLCAADEPPYASATADLVKASYVNATRALRWLNGRYASPQPPIGLGIVKELKIGNQHLHPTASLIQIIQ
jgi:predicted transcriptional regulator with HTH domain